MRSHHTPSLRRHKASALGVVTLDGNDVYLGRWPAAQKKPPAAVRAEYDRRVAEWLANGRRLTPAPEPQRDGVTVSQLILAFHRHAEAYYRREDGTATSELNEFRYSLRPLRELYGAEPAADFGPRKLKAVRQRMIDAGWCRTLINRRVKRVRHVFKWGVAEELVPPDVFDKLAAVGGLAKGRTKAPESEAVEPVAEAHVAATLPFLTAHPRAMVELQLLTGMRPGEVRLMRAGEIDTGGDVWLYRPSQHKTRHRGKARVVVLGPRAREIVKPFLTLGTQAFLFSPRAAVELRRTEMRARRKSKVQPSQVSRKKRKPQKQPGACYSANTYAQAVAKAVLAANTAAACAKCTKLAPADRCDACTAAAIPHWHPHQLRHTHATEVRRRFGLEAAQVALGHAQAQVTEVYAERDLTLAAKVARQIG